MIYQLHSFTPAQDAAIKAAYQSAEYRSRHGGTVGKLAKAFMVKPSAISYRAMQLEVRPELRLARLPWTQPEIDIMENNLEQSVQYVKKILHKYGFERSLVAIKTYRSRYLGGKEKATQLRIDKGIYSTPQLAKLLGVSDRICERWVASGMIEKTTLPGYENPSNWINEKAIKKFIAHYPGAVNQHKCDFVWVVGILSGIYSSHAGLSQ